MLSILIPVYNFDVTALVKELHHQALQLNMAFEIILLDDASTNKTTLESNKKTTDLSNVQYEQLPTNIGRSAIRNLLAKKAKHEYLLFMDCDSQVNTSAFLSNYISQLKPNTVLCGGRNYQSETPKETSKYLRWYYGVKRETNTAVQRSLKPYCAFQTNNFLIPKEVYLSVQLNEALVGYGHEDTLFGFELEKKGIAISHIDNPLCHIGLEDADEFIAKTKQGLNNLKYLIDNKFPVEEIKLAKYYKLFHAILLSAFIIGAYKVFKKNIYENLTSSKPNLFLFDFMKLAELLKK